MVQKRKKEYRTQVYRYRIHLRSITRHAIQITLKECGGTTALTLPHAPE